MMGLANSSMSFSLGLLSGLFQKSSKGYILNVKIIALPIIFAAGMSMMDALDGIFMTKAYSWAFTSPLRKIYYNITTTGLSVFVALGIGTVQWISVASDNFGLGDTEPFKSITAIDLSSIGYFIVLSFVLTFALSILIWKIGKYEQRFGAKIKDIDHTHTGLHIG